MAQHRNIPSGGACSGRFTDYSGVFFDEFAENSAWIREEGLIQLPPLDGVGALVLKGEFRTHPDARGIEVRFPALAVAIDGVSAGKVFSSKPGPWELRFALPPSGGAAGPVLTLGLEGVVFTNVLA